MTWDDRARRLTLEPGAAAGATNLPVSRTFRVRLQPAGGARDVRYTGTRVVVSL
jgi:hypothetical protein